MTKNNFLIVSLKRILLSHIL